MDQKDRLVSPKENVIIGKLIPAGTGLRSRREQLEWMPKPRGLAAIFGEEEAVTPLPEDLSLEDLDDDEDEDDELEGDIVDEAVPAEGEVNME